MISFSFRSLNRVAAFTASFALAWSAYAQGPLLPPQKEKKKEKHEFSESPAKKFLENRPASKVLPKANMNPPRVPALKGPASPLAGPVWTALGPFPIPNGQTENRVDPVSGRVTAIAIHPSNANIAYVGAAQGGLYRTLDGGATWTQLMDNAASTAIGTPLAIGAVTIDPTNPSNVLVGTNFWQQASYSFSAISNGTPLTISGHPLGMLFDHFQLVDQWGCVGRKI